MFDSVLVVCIGNICRSPMAERILQSLLPKIQISSAGVDALVGQEMDERASQLILKHGLQSVGHKSRQLTPEICRVSDLILVMTKFELNKTREIAPEATGKVMLFGKWIDDKEISDPYRCSNEMYGCVFSLIEKAAHTWVSKLMIHEQREGKHS